jgi:hypothetical protein
MPQSDLLTERVRIMRMKLLAIVGLTTVLAAVAVAAPVGSSARSVIPAQSQQIISVDYRALRNSDSGMALKNRVLPDNLKQFEDGLKAMGINPDKDVEQLTFIAFREKNGVRSIGIAQGSFPMKTFLARTKTKKIKPAKYRSNDLYPASAGMVVNFLDPTTIVFGDSSAVKAALDTRDGELQSLANSSKLSSMMADVESGPVWSVLDEAGTQTMMKSALGEAAKLADYENIKKRLLGSNYIVDFSRGVNFDLTVVTADNMTASTMSSLIKAGVMFKKANGSAAEKSALDGMTVNSDASDLQIHFKADDRKFESLLQTDLFAAVSK